MRYVKYLLVVLLLMPSSLLYGQEYGQETKKEEAKSEAKQEAPEAQGKVKRIIATVDPDGVQRVEIIGGEYYFDPNYIVVKANVPVEFRVKASKDSAWYIPHAIVVKAPEAGIDFKVEITKGGSTIKFTPTKDGKYPMYCDQKPPFGGKSHQEKGMEGTIEVVE